MHLSTWDWGFDNYGPRLKEYRRVFHQLLGPKQIPQYRPVMAEEVHFFLQHLLSTPADFAYHVQTYVGILHSYFYERYINTYPLRFVGSTIIRIAYGSSDPKINASRVADVEHLVESFVPMLRPGHLLVDFIPLLRYIPSWLPGASWKRELDRIRELAYHMAKSHYIEAKERLVSGPYPRQLYSRVDSSSISQEGGNGSGGYPSVVQQFLENVSLNENDGEQSNIEEVGQFTASLSFLGASKSCQFPSA